MFVTLAQISGNQLGCSGCMYDSLWILKWFIKQQYFFWVAHCVICRPIDFTSMTFKITMKISLYPQCPSVSGLYFNIGRWSASLSLMYWFMVSMLFKLTGTDKVGSFPWKSFTLMKYYLKCISYTYFSH